jgi:hypothetical protein
MSSGDAPAEAPPTLGALRVKFSEGRGGSTRTFKVGCDPAKAVTEPAWRPAHDAALAEALRALAALERLPTGPKGKEGDAWRDADAQLRHLRAGLQATGLKLEAARGHKCTPGYDNASCKQVRPARQPAAAGCGRL